MRSCHLQDAQGNSASANLTVYVEQRSVSAVAYAFISPNVTNGTAAQEYAARLRANATVFEALVVQRHLPQFDIWPAYQPLPSATQRFTRLVGYNILNLTAAPSPTNASIWEIQVSLNVTLVSTPPRLP